MPDVILQNMANNNGAPLREPPVHEQGGIAYIRLSEVDARERAAFECALIGSQLPVVPGEQPGNTIYAFDWYRWRRRGR